MKEANLNMDDYTVVSAEESGKCHGCDLQKYKGSLSGRCPSRRPKCSYDTILKLKEGKKMKKRGLRLKTFVRYTDTDGNQFDGIIIGYHFVNNTYYYVVELDHPKKIVMIEHKINTSIDHILVEIDVIRELDDFIKIMEKDKTHNEVCVRAFLAQEGEYV